MSMEEDLIDFSSENDNLIVNSSSPLHSWTLEDNPSSGATNIQEEMDMAREGKQDEQFLPLHESMEPEKARRKGKVNLRKSLAWDSAFFTDAGVLDAEELSCMIKGAEHGGKHNLPMIEEDVRQSTDSISSLESDNLTLEHIEAELFGDIRASIQKVMIPSNGDVSAKTDNGANSSVKKADLASKDRMKPKLPPRQIFGAQAGTPKSQPKRITGTQRLGTGLKPDKTQVTQSITRTTDGASLKPPKISTRLQPTSASVTKRASLDITRAKIDNDNTKTSSASVRGAQTQKVSASNNASRVLPKPAASSNASRVLPKPALSMKPSSVRSSAAMKVHAIRSSSESSGSTTSDKTGKSSLPVARRKVDSRPIAQPSASSKLKAPSRAALKSKIPSGNSAVSAYLMSSKINSTISPASSISEWSSASSSSSATTNQRSSKSRTSLETSSCRSFDSDASALDLKSHSSDHTSDKSETRGTTLGRESLKQAGTISRPASMKPTGLRMPTPKMGYFEGMKAVRTPNGTHSSSSSPLPKTEATICSPKVNSNMKGKSVKVPLRANRKPETLKHPSPASSSDKSNVSDNHSGVPSKIILIPESFDVHHEMIGVKFSENMDVVSEGPASLEHVQSAGFVVSKSENQSVVGNTGAISVATKEVAAEGPETVEHVAGDGSVKIKSENQVILNNDTHVIKSENQRNNKDVVAEGPDAVEHVAAEAFTAIKSGNEVTVDNDMHVIKSENKKNNKEVVTEGPEAVVHIAGDGLIAVKSENEVIADYDTVLIKSESQRIASALNNKEVLAEGPDTVEHIASDGLVAVKGENQGIADTLKDKKTVAEESDIVEHVAGDGLVAIESENQVIVNNDTNVIKSEYLGITNALKNKEAAVEEPDTVEHVAGDGLVAIKSENEVIVNNDSVLSKSESQSIASTLKDKEAVAEEPDTVEHVADGLVAIKSENQVIVNNDSVVIKSESQSIGSTLNYKEVVAEEPDTVEHVSSDDLVGIKSDNQTELNNDMIADLVGIKGEDEGVTENEMNLDTAGNVDIRTTEGASVEKDSISESSRQCQTVDRDGVRVQCNLNCNSDVLYQNNDTNLEVNVNGESKNTKNDRVELEIYDSNFNGAETMSQCQSGDEGKVDVKDDLNTLYKTNVEKDVYANQEGQLNSQVQEVSTTPFSDKVESLLTKLSHLSLHTPEIEVRRTPLAVKNSSGDCLDFSEGAVQLVGKTDLDLPSLEVDHKENSNL